MRKKNKKSVLQTAPPLWRNLIYINILHNCDVRFRSRRRAEQSHARFPTVAQRVITRISMTNLQKIFRHSRWVAAGCGNTCKDGTSMHNFPLKIKRSIGDFGRQNWSWHGPSGVAQRRVRNSAATTSSRNVSSPLQACNIPSAWSSKGC